MNIVVMGCGRVGARVASILDHSGYSVTVIDTDARAFRRLAPEFKGDTIIGTGIDEDVLKLAGIQDAGTFVATTNGDNRNIMAGQVARIMFGVPQVIIRIYDPVRADTYRRLGYATVCPTTTVSALIIDQVTGATTAGQRPESKGA
jgi:trk system potassium uptake protein TrkA